MEKLNQAVILVFLGAVFLAAVAMGEHAGVLLQEGIYAEEAEGDLDKAIGIYERVLADFAESQRVAAKAAYQLGMCYLKKGQEEKAAEYFGQVVSKYASQKVLVEKAREQLDKLRPDAKSVFEEIDGQVIRFISGKYGETADVAGQKNLYANSHVYYVDSNFVLYNGGMGFYYNWTGRTITEKVRLSGTSYPNQTLYDSTGQELNIEIVPAEDRSNHWYIYWIPDEPLAPGESLYYGWSIDDSRALPSRTGETAALRMQNQFGSPVIETFFLVLPKVLKISQSNPPTGSEELLNFDVYWWTKTVQQGEEHFESVVLARSAEMITDVNEISRIVRKAVLTISTCAETDPKVSEQMEMVNQVDQSIAVSELTGYLDSGVMTTRRAAIYILWKGRFESIDSALPKLRELCSSEEEYTRGMAALALGEVGDNLSFGILTDMTLKDDSAYARRCAAYALGCLGNDEALPVLKQALNDSDLTVKNNAQAAITMLTELKEAEAK